MRLQRADAPCLRVRWLALILLLAPVLTVARPQPAVAAGVVSQCTEAALRSALAGGGLVTFGCSGVIPLAAPIELTSDTVIDGGGVVTIDGQGTTNLFVVKHVVNHVVTVDMAGLTLIGGLTPDFGVGGAIENYGDLTIISSTFEGNTANSSIGGAIYNAGTLTMTGSTLVGNDAQVGGAIYNDGLLTIMESTLAGNDAQIGGAIYNSFGTAMITASTLAGNDAQTGGAIGNDGTLTITASTLSDNIAHTAAGGTIYNFFGGSVTVTASILSGSSLCSAVPPASSGYNVASDASCSLTATGDLQNANPLLGPLTNNGGPTETLMPLTGSPALDRVPNAVCVTLAAANDGHDQRGAPRPESAGLACDSGAVELQNSLFFCVGERSGAVRYVSVPNGCVRGEYRLLPSAEGVYAFCVGDRSGTMRYLPNPGTNCLRGEWKLTLPQVDPITICVGERSRTVRYVADAAACNVRGELPYLVLNPAG